MPPQTTKQWTVEGADGFESLKFNKSASIPKIGSHDVLVKFHAASLNYRDLVISKVWKSLDDAQPSSNWQLVP